MADADSLDVSELLDEVRTYYLVRLLAAIEEQAAGADEVVVEAELVDGKGEPTREGALGQPVRVDLVVIREGQEPESIQVDTKGMVSFEPLLLEWDGQLPVELHPFQWNWCPLSIAIEGDIERLGPVVEWFEDWFLDEGLGEPPLIGAVHLITDPKVVDERVELAIDLGSVPVEAIEGLLDACLASGATHLRIGDDGSAADEPADEPADEMQDAEP